MIFEVLTNCCRFVVYHVLCSCHFSFFFNYNIGQLFLFVSPSFFIFIILSCFFPFIPSSCKFYFHSSLSFFSFVFFLSFLSVLYVVSLDIHSSSKFVFSVLLRPLSFLFDLSLCRFLFFYCILFSALSHVFPLIVFLLFPCIFFTLRSYSLSFFPLLVLPLFSILSSLPPPLDTAVTTILQLLLIVSSFSSLALRSVCSASYPVIVASVH